MELTINGLKTSIKDECNVVELLENMNLKEKTVAVAVDGRFVPRSEHSSFILQEGQEIELVRPMQGG